LELSIPRDTECTVNLMNAWGQPVQTLHQGTLGRGIQRLFVHAENLQSGSYFVTLTTDRGIRWTERLVVQH
jgi:hypothetical protein